jgi:serine/threonine protein kinase
MIGERVGNHKILTKIGQGGMGTVFQGEDTTLGRKVAIKILNPNLLEKGGKELERFEAEAKVQASLNHPNIVTLYQFEPYRDSYCMVMEYVEGKTLSEVIKSSGPLPAHIVVNLSKQVLDGLGAAHRLGVVHRDLKPSNVMITGDGVAKVMDFGIAKVEGGKRLTESGALVGTVYYMSPEQVRGEKVDARSDVYSFGIIMFEMLTGRVPFKEDSDFSIMIHHVQTPAPPPTQLLPDIPSALEDIVLRCLNKDPATRFQSAGEIVAALEAFEEQERALGRSQMYSKRYLAEWIASPRKEAPGSPAPPPLPMPQPVVQGRPPLPPPIPRPAIPAKKSLAPLLILLVLVVAAVAATLYVRNRAASAPPESLQVLQPTEPGQAQPPVEAQAGINAPAAEQPADSAAVPALRQDAGSLQAGGTAAPAAVAGGKSRKEPAASTPPGVAATAVRQAPAGRAPETAPPAQVQEQVPQGFLVFLDLDQGSEPMSLGSAAAQIAQVVRENGHTIVSSGVAGASVRSALDRKDLAEVRRNGVGYVIMGTANGALEPQAAYGTTYYAGQVSVQLELVRMTDGSIAASGSGEAKSRGTANPQAALNTALTTAVSNAARELMRSFTP